jgi:small-conductance mechanosensitive channel/CRP-like cAMP-binding protein
MLIGLLLLVATLVLRAATTRNRHIQRKLFASAIAFSAYAALGLVSEYAPLTSSAQQQIHTLQPLLLAFGIINLLVAVVINPWRDDHLPDRFPNIVQDALIVVIFGATAIVMLRDRAVVTTAAGAVVLGLALQDTLGNLFAGLAIQIEKPFRVGHWVSLGGEEGLVKEITWRATKIRTKAGNFVIVPNNVLARDRIVNFSEPTPQARLEVEISASYDTPPNDVKNTILEALRDEPLIAGEREPEVLVWEFGDFAIKYLIQVWTSDFGADRQVRDHVRTAVYYAFRRRGINVPYPIQMQFQREWTEPAVDRRSLETALKDAEIFAPLTGEQRSELLAMARSCLYGTGEVIVREGAAGSSMFVIVDGEAAVTLKATANPVARLHEGDFFGEMSLLTGDPRTATVSAATDCHVIEITADRFRAFVMTEPVAADIICTAVAGRRAELEQHRSAASGTRQPSEPPRSLMARMRQFLRLSTG